MKWFVFALAFAFFVSDASAAVCFFETTVDQTTTSTPIELVRSTAEGDTYMATADGHQFRAFRKADGSNLKFRTESLTDAATGGELNGRRVDLINLIGYGGNSGKAGSPESVVYRVECPAGS